MNKKMPSNFMGLDALKVADLRKEFAECKL